MATVTIRTNGTDLNGAEITGIATQETVAAILAESELFTKLYNEQSKKQEDQRKKFNKKFDELLAEIGIISAIHSANNSNNTTTNATNTDPSANLTKLGEGAGKLAELFGEGAGELTGLFEVVETLVPEIGLVVLAFEGVKMVTATLEAFVNILGQTTTAYLEGKTQLADYTQAIVDNIKSLPIVGGLLGGIAGILQYAIKVFTEWNETLTNLSTVGASFGNNLLVMRGAAAEAGLTLQEFAGIVNANAAGMSEFGGTVTEGALLFSKISGQSLRQFGTSISNLAGGIQAYSDDLPNLIALLDPNMSARNTSQQQLTTSAFALAKEMDLMSKLTGETRKQQMDQIKQAQNTAAYQMKYAEMSIEQRQRADMIMNESIARFGKEVGPQVGQMIALGTVPTTDSLKILTATMPGAINAFKEVQAVSDSSRGSIANFGNILDKNSAIAADAIGKTSKSFESIQGYSNIYSDNVNGVILANKKYMDATGQIQGNFTLQAKANAAKEQAARDSTRDSLNNFSIGIRESFETFFMEVIKPLSGMFEPIVKNIGDGMTEAVQITQSLIKFVSEHLQSSFKSLGSFSFSGIVKWGSDLIKNNLDSMISLFKEFTSWASTVTKEDIKGFGDDLLSIFGAIKSIAGGINTVGKVANGAQQAVGWADGTSELGWLKDKIQGHSGGTASTGTVIRDFGRETPALLHGKEAVLTEDQLQNLVNNTKASVPQTNNNDNLAPILKTIDNKMAAVNDSFEKMLLQLQDINDSIDKNVKHSAQIVKALV